MRNATIEVEVREEMAQELQDTVQRMHEEFSARLRDQVREPIMITGQTLIPVLCLGQRWGSQDR
jgi:hypothetical protein